MIDFDWCWLTLVGVDCCIWMQLFFVSCWLLLWNLTWKWQGCQWFWTPSRLAKPSLHVLRRRNLPKKRSKMIISELILKKCWLILTKFQISQNHLASSGLKRLANKKKIICFFLAGLVVFEQSDLRIPRVWYTQPSPTYIFSSGKMSWLKTCGVSSN